MIPETASHAPLRTFISPEALPIWMEGKWPNPSAKEAFQQMVWHIANCHHERPLLLFRDGYSQVDSPLQITGVWDRDSIERSFLVITPSRHREFALNQCVPFALTLH